MKIEYHIYLLSNGLFAARVQVGSQRSYITLGHPESVAIWNIKRHLEEKDADSSQILRESLEWGFKKLGLKEITDASLKEIEEGFRAR